MGAKAWALCLLTQLVIADHGIRLMYMYPVELTELVRRYLSICCHNEEDELSIDNSRYLRYLRLLQVSRACLNLMIFLYLKFCFAYSCISESAIIVSACLVLIRHILRRHSGSISVCFMFSRLIIFSPYRANS